MKYLLKKHLVPSINGHEQIHVFIIISIHISLHVLIKYVDIKLRMYYYCNINNYTPNFKIRGAFNFEEK